MVPGDRRAARARELKEALRFAPVDGRSALPESLRAVAELLDFEQGVAYGVAAEEDAFALTFLHTYGLPAEPVTREFSAFVGTRQERWGMYDPVRPEAAQRNTVRATAGIQQLLELAESERARVFAGVGVRPQDRGSLVPQLREMAKVYAAMGVHRKAQIRTLLCDGPVLLAWLGGFRAEPFGASDRKLFTELVPALKARARQERLLSDAQLDRDALVATLDHLPAAAFVVSATGRVRHANLPGQAALAKDRTGLGERLERWVRGRKGGPDAEVVRVGAVAATPQWLVVLRTGADAAARRVSAAARRWGLTGRQAQVLALVAQGLPNKTVAANLGCATHTVELHVSAILARAEVPNRAALIAALGDP